MFIIKTVTQTSSRRRSKKNRNCAPIHREEMKKTWKLEEEKIAFNRLCLSSSAIALCAHVMPQWTRSHVRKIVYAHTETTALRPATELNEERKSEKRRIKHQSHQGYSFDKWIRFYTFARKFTRSESERNERKAIQNGNKKRANEQRQREKRTKKKKKEKRTNNKWVGVLSRPCDFRRGFFSFFFRVCFRSRCSMLDALQSSMCRAHGTHSQRVNRARRIIRTHTPTTDRNEKQNGPKITIQQTVEMWIIRCLPSFDRNSRPMWLKLGQSQLCRCRYVRVQSASWSAYERNESDQWINE